MKSPTPFRSPGRQHGVVLVIALVMLVVISLLATFSIRNSVSSEAVSGNVRTTQLASQAAEVALRFCEDALVDFKKNGTALPAGADGTLTIQPNASNPLGVSTTNWDVSRTGVFILPAEKINLGTAETFKRLPECVAEEMPVVNAAGTGLVTTTYLVTARGFGPEVADGTGRPVGSEVFLQSTLEIE